MVQRALRFRASECTGATQPDILSWQVIAVGSTAERSEGDSSTINVGIDTLSTLVLWTVENRSRNSDASLVPIKACDLLQRRSVLWLASSGTNRGHPAVVQPGELISARQGSYTRQSNARFGRF